MVWKLLLRKVWGHKTNACGSCDDIFYTRTELIVHVHKLHEGDDNNEVKKKETIESDITHEKKSKNDETEVKSNGKRIRKANSNINGKVECDQWYPNLKRWD